MSPQPSDDRRSHDRKEVNLPGAAFVLCESEVTAIEVWTRNISAGGVSLLSRQELRGDRMLLQLPQPEFRGKLIECVVKHRSRYDRELMSGEVESRFVCGLKFERVLSVEDVHASLRDAFEVSTGSPSADVALQSTGANEESLMPLLSAIGLAVVYTSMIP